MPRPSLFPTVACVQHQIKLGAIDENVERVRALIADFQPEPETLLLLPEMWATGFDYPHTEELGAKTPDILRIMQEIALEYGVYLAGSLIVPDKACGLPRNSLCLVGPTGLIASRGKQHLFAHWRENAFFQPDANPLPMRAVQTPCDPLASLICYDLRFPELARQQAFHGARLLLISGQWPKARLDHWLVLLRARAIENQMYVAAANGYGMSGQMELGGLSMIIDPNGKWLVPPAEGEEIISANLSDVVITEQRRLFCPAGERPWPGDDKRKICADPDTLLVALDAIRRQGAQVAFTNGCFDILHAGHVSYLQEARRFADCLVVGLNSDASVRALKGSGRPVNKQAERARVLAALGCVDFVVLFDEETPLELIRRILPDVLVKGADWPEDQIVGQAEVKAKGGRVERIAFDHDCSTTGIIEHIRKQTDNV